MQAYHPDRVVKALTRLVSIAFVVLLGAGIAVLIATPALKLFASDAPEWMWGLEVPATLSNSGATVSTTWGSAQLEVEDIRAQLRMPIGVMPWWLFALLDCVLEECGMTLTELSERLGMTLANLSILKTNKARAIRFSTLDAICRELECQP